MTVRFWWGGYLIADVRRDYMGGDIMEQNGCHYDDPVTPFVI